jgi:membrane protein
MQVEVGYYKGPEDEPRKARSGAAQEGRGRHADTPSEIPSSGWKDILVRIWNDIGKDRILLIAAGTTFYLMLALFPFLAAFVSLYGFFADPADISGYAASLDGVLPGGGLQLIEKQLETLAAQEQGTLSIGFIVGLATTLWSVGGGVKAIMEGLNVVYSEDEKRNFLWLSLVALGFSLGLILLGIILLLAIGVVPAVLTFFNLGSVAEVLLRVGRWPVLLVIIAAALAVLYRYGPSRDDARIRWLSWGAGLATLLWIATSWGFSYYLENFADYNATYGSLGAIIGFMLWTWLSVSIVLLGGKLNAEMEHQTARDTTTGRHEPMGARGATVADTLGEPAPQDR